MPSVNASSVEGIQQFGQFDADTSTSYTVPPHIFSLITFKLADLFFFQVNLPFAASALAWRLKPGSGPGLTGYCTMIGSIGGVV